MSERSWPDSLLSDRRAIWVVGLFAALFFLATDLPWRLDDYDQAKQAFTSFEMIKEGHWFYQRTPHEHVATKPPLVGWISAALFTVTRSWDAAWRLPSLLSAAAIFLLLFRYAGGAYGTVSGVIAAGAFSFNLLAPRLAMLARTDMPLALVIFLTGALIWLKLREKAAWNIRDQFAIFCLLTAGMMIKGPIVYAFLLPGLIAFQLSRRKSGASSAWPGWWPWVASLAIFLLWVGVGIAVVPGFYDQVVVREFAGRFGGEFHRSQPWYFYLPHLLHKFAPWSILMIFLTVVWIRRASRPLILAMPHETCWLVCWIFGGLIVMSLLPSKRVDRIFPIIPPLCLLLGAQGACISGREQLNRNAYRWVGAAMIISLLFTSGYSFWKVSSGYRNHRDTLVNFGREVRAQASTHHWRYEVISAPDEGLLLYLQRTHFISPDRALAEWNGGSLDGLVVSEEQLAGLMADLKNSVLSLRSVRREGDATTGYVLITRR